ncbi:MAG: EAL domain-containing protein [Salinisphaera sp.]|nr:EAL domain-containing protein [Salinisphaera sp.]
MISTDDATPEPAPSATRPMLTVWLAGEEPGELQSLGDTIKAIDPSLDVVPIGNPAQAIHDAGTLPPELCLLAWSSGHEAGRRGLDLLRSLVTDMAVILVGEEATLPTLGDALAAGAWDRIATDQGDEVIWTQTQRALQMAQRQHRLAEADRRLLSLQRRLEVLTSDGSDASAKINAGLIEQARPGFARLLGAESVDAVNGTAFETWLQSEDRAAYAGALEQVANPASETDTNIVFRPPSGSRSHAVRALLRATATSGSLVDIVLHEAERRQPHLSGASKRVPVDGRMALHRVLAQASVRAKTYVLGLLFFAVDDVAGLQAKYGLSGSDVLLQETGLFLLETLRGNDRCFRFAAGEYALVLERESQEQVASAAQRALNAFRDERFGDDQQAIHLSATVAYTILSHDATENDGRLHRLVQAAYNLSARGGNDLVNCTQVAVSADVAKASDDWGTRLRQALVHDRFSLAYQNITSLAGDTQSYFDVLLRYIDDRGALIRPGEFLPAASQTGLLPEIDRWVVSRAVKVIEQQMARDVHISLFIKLSGDTLVDCRDFLAWVRSDLADISAPHTSLIFSVRDEDMRKHAAETKHLFTSLTALGFRTALTHFGNAAATGQLIDSLSVSFIKLSPELARKVAGKSADDSQLIHAIDSARNRDIPLIAEQIEDASSMARLWQAGVNYVQGHFIQEPDTEALTHSELGRR